MSYLLPRELAAHPDVGASVNLALRYQRYVPLLGDPQKRPYPSLRQEETGPYLKQLVREWNAALAGGAAPVAALREALRAHHERQARLLKGLPGAQPCDTLHLVTRKRLLVGHGEASVFETGMTLHHTLGVPYLPGSALKGVTRHWVAQAKPGHPLIAELFGPADTDDARPGRAIFFDALPVAPPALGCTGQTPHYRPYYSEQPGGRHPTRPPADWYQPKPFSYLVVVPGAQFDIRLALHRAPDWPDQLYAELRQMLADWVTQALCRAGIGGKTRRGYGRMRKRQP